MRAIHAPANLERLETALKEELQRALKEGFTQDELESVRQAWAQRRAQALADESTVASVLASNLYWDDTMQRWIDFNEAIRTTSLDEVNAAFRKYLRPEQVLVIGAGEFGRKIE